MCGGDGEAKRGRMSERKWVGGCLIVQELIQCEVDRSPATSFCTNLPGHSREVIHLFLIEIGTVLYRNLVVIL